MGEEGDVRKKNEMVEKREMGACVVTLYMVQGIGFHLSKALDPDLKVFKLNKYYRTLIIPTSHTTYFTHTDASF